jgi:hypothetical protein
MKRPIIAKQITHVAYLNIGAARVPATHGVLDKWKTEVNDARYVQAASDLFEKLGYTPSK